MSAILAVSPACVSFSERGNERSAEAPDVPVYTYKIVNTYPHDAGAFTQGLVFANGALYEGTGLYGQSSLRKIDLESGKVLQMRTLPPEHFGEGITIFGDTIIQLTWKSNKGFVYKQTTFEPLQEFSYGTEGWGLTNDGKHLIMSDGTAILYILDPETFKNVGQVAVLDNGKPVRELNELEYVNGLIYANVWNTDNIVMIDPDSGRVKGWIDLTGILPRQVSGQVDVLNGIAYDVENGRLFVTGKLWPWLFEIRLERKQ